MASIGIIGSGNLGANVAFYIAERNVAHVRLHDAQKGLSTGKALDMMEAAPLRGYRRSLTGTDEVGDLLGSSVVVIAAGAVREPGMQREELYSANAPVVAAIAERLLGYAGVVLVATEPVDLLTAVVFRAAELPRQRVIGLGGALDSLRLRRLIAEELGVSAGEVSATVIGSHSEAMMPLASYCSVAGVPIARLMARERIDELFERTRIAGDRILELARRSSAYYGPAAAACDILEAVVCDTRRVLSVSTVLDGQYGIRGVALSLPAVMGAEGAHRLLQPRLEAPDIERLRWSALRAAEITGEELA